MGEIKKPVKAKVILKHELEANWLQSTYVPEQGEQVIYDREIDADGNILALPEGRTEPINYQRLKLGDGILNVNELPFISNELLQIAKEYTDGALAQKTQIKFITWEEND